MGQAAGTSPVALRLRRLAEDHGPEAQAIYEEAKRRVDPSAEPEDEELIDAVDVVEKERYDQ